LSGSSGQHLRIGDAGFEFWVNALTIALRSSLTTSARSCTLLFSSSANWISQSVNKTLLTENETIDHTESNGSLPPDIW